MVGVPGFTPQFESADFGKAGGYLDRDFGQTRFFTKAQDRPYRRQKRNLFSFEGQEFTRLISTSCT